MKLFIIRFLSKMRDLYYTFKRFVTSFVEVDPKLILFSAYAGTKFSDSPYQLFEHLNNADYDYQLAFVFTSSEMMDAFKQAYPQHKAIKHNSLKHYHYLNKAGYWIFNYKTPSYFKKKPETIFLQTWHGIPLKKLGNDIVNVEQTFYRSQQSYIQMAESYTEEGRKANYFLTPSPYALQHLQSAFRLSDKQILKFDYPRNELLYNYTKEDIKAIKDELKLPLDKKIILYAPTWRDHNYSVITGYKTKDFLLDFEELGSLKDEYIILYRPHYLISDRMSNLPDNVYDVRDYQNSSEIYIISDMLVTDYSSVYFDYSILKRPIYFYMKDLDFYQQQLRGFYIDINVDLPNDYYTEQDKLIKAINTKHINKKKYNHFYKHNKPYPLDNEALLKAIKIKKAQTKKVKEKTSKS